MPTENVGHYIQGRAGTSLWTVNLRLRTVEKGLGYEVAQNRQTWAASVRDVVNSIGDATTSTSKVPSNVL